MKKLLALCPLALCLLVPHVDAAPPKAKKSTAASRVFSGKPTRDRGSLPDADATIPNEAARAAAASLVVGTAVSVQEVLWASVTPRRPKDDDRAALVFTGAALVDAKRGIAKWTTTVSSGSPGTTGGFQPIPADELGCIFFGCPGGEDAGGDRGMQLWVNGESSKRYYAECRVKLDGSKGTMKVAADGFNAAFTLDHTGKSYARFGWVIDPSASGWFGFSLSTSGGWTAHGCSIDELE